MVSRMVIRMVSRMVIRMVSQGVGGGGGPLTSHMVKIRERVLFIGTQFIMLYSKLCSTVK
jgi:hypothetical protein